MIKVSPSGRPHLAHLAGVAAGRKCKCKSADKASDGAGRHLADAGATLSLVRGKSYGAPRGGWQACRPAGATFERGACRGAMAKAICAPGQTLTARSAPAHAYA